MIRNAVVADTPKIVALELDIFDNPYPYQIVESDIKANKVMVMEHDGNIVGYITVSHVLDTGEIERVAVHKDFLRRGYATQLMNEALKHLSSLGVKDIFLEVRDDNHQAIGLYTKCGFVTTGVRHNYYHDGGLRS